MPRTLSADELRRRGEKIYRDRIVAHLDKEDTGKYVLIDVASGDYEVGADEIAASNRLLKAHPDAQVWFRRVGSSTVRRYGARRTGR